MSLEARNVTRQFLRLRDDSNVFDAVKHVSLTLENKTVTVITGPSGSGKSTLLNMMAGILSPTEGTIAIDGTDLYSMDDEHLSRFRNQHIGVVPQGQTAIHSLTVMDNVLLPYMLYGGRNKKQKNAGAEDRLPEAEEVRSRAEKLLERTGISDLAGEMPSQLSGGELRRVAIARAMVMKPDVILADEPTADLDEENTKIVLSLMRYAAEEGSAVMIVTHDKEVLPEADRVFSLSAGELSDSTKV